MKVLKKLTVAGALIAGVAFGVTAQAGQFDNLSGLQLKPLMAQAFQVPQTGVSFGGHNFIVKAPAQCGDNGDGTQICHVLLAHSCRQDGYYLVVDQSIHPQTKQLVTQVSAYPDMPKVVLTYTQSYLPGSALNVVAVQPANNF
jgi:hypothetical protein